jgi:uncharacterized protein (TIGR02996 family)
MATAPRPELFSFLGAIKAEPEEDTPKLALADWLQEQPDPADQARGEFLRQFVRNNQLAKTDPAREDFAALVRLWNANESEWVGRLRTAGLTVWATNHMFRWGLLYPALSVSPGTARTVRPLAGTEEYAWVAGLALRVLDPAEVPTFVGSGLLDSLVGLTVPHTEWAGAFLNNFCASPRAAGLLSLDLEPQPGMLAAVVVGRHLTALRHLTLRRRWGDVDLQPLFNAPHLNALRILDATGIGLNSTAGAVIASGTGLPALVELYLGPSGYTRNALGPTGFRALIAGARGGRLRKLFVASNGVKDAGVKALRSRPHMCNLTHLDLADNDLTDRAAEAIAQAEHLKSLEHLDLKGNAITDVGARTLAKAPHLTNIRRLVLSRANRITRISEQGADALHDRFGEALVLV